MKLIRLISLFAFATALPLAAPFGGAALAQEPIKIGVSVSMSGRYAVTSQNRGRAYQLCVKHANEKGGVLDRQLELIIEDDKSDVATAVKNYERLITEKGVDAVLGPYGSSATDAVATVTEKCAKPLLSLGGAARIYQKGRRFVFMVAPPAGGHLEGIIDLAATRGLKTVAVIGGDSIYARAAAAGAVELAKRKGLNVVFSEEYPKGTTDFAPLITRLRSANPDVVAAATYFVDAVAITRQMKALDVNPKVFGVTVGGNTPKFYKTLGKDAEFVYGASQWEPDLVSLRAGGLVLSPSRASFRVRASSSRLTGRSIRAPASVTIRRMATRVVSYCSRPFGRPGRWTLSASEALS